MRDAARKGDQRYATATDTQSIEAPPMTAVYILLNLFWQWLDWNEYAPTKASSKNLRPPPAGGLSAS